LEETTQFWGGFGQVHDEVTLAVICADCDGAADLAAHRTRQAAFG
jgi:hypothetical protein